MPPRFAWRVPDTGLVFARARGKILVQVVTSRMVLEAAVTVAPAASGPQQAFGI
jgi:hypothetical protein